MELGSLGVEANLWKRGAEDAEVLVRFQPVPLEVTCTQLDLSNAGYSTALWRWVLCWLMGDESFTLISFGLHGFDSRQRHLVN
jgi:hypothetical protein